jgi:hypothetical protein
MSGKRWLKNTLGGPAIVRELRRRLSLVQGAGSCSFVQEKCQNQKRSVTPCTEKIAFRLFSSTFQPGRRILGEKGHLVDCYCIQFYKPFRLGNILADEVGIEILEIREADKLRDIGVIPDITALVRVAVPPFFCSGPEERHVEEIGFRCVDPVDLGRVELGWDQVLFNRVRVNPVIDLREVAPDIPAELLAFLILEALEFFDEIKLEFHRDPRSEFKRDVLVGIGPAVPSGFCPDATGVCHLDPLFRRKGETVETGLFSKPVELDGIKIRVIELLPDAEELDRVAVAEPATDKIVRIIGVLIPSDIGDADVILIVLYDNTNFAVEYLDLRHDKPHKQPRISG